MGYNSPMNESRHTIKIPLSVLRLLRLVAAITGEKQHAILRRLLTAEWSRVQQKGSAWKPPSPY